MVITLTYLLAWITLMQGHALPHKHHSMQGSRKFFVTSDNAPPSYRTGCANCDKNAHCVKANCVCKRDYVGNGLVCDRRSACLPNPCHNGGSCHIFDDDEARCVCTNDRNGKYCDMEKEIMHAIEGPNHHADGTPSHEFAMHPHNISLKSHEEDDYYHPHEEYHGEHHGEVYNKGHEDHIPSFHHDEGYHEGHSPMPVADSWHEGHDEHVSMPIHHDEGYHDGHMEGFHGDLDHTAPMPIYHEGGDSYHDGGHYGHMPIHHEESYHHDGGEHMEHSSPHHQTYQDELHIDREGFPVHHEEEFHHDGGDDHVYHEHEHEHEHFHDLACHSDPCWNGATCIDEYHGGFKCICRTGWRGPLCEEQEESDPCRPNPCKQGETCIDYGQSFRCKPAKDGPPAPTGRPRTTRRPRTPPLPSPPLPPPPLPPPANDGPPPPPPGGRPPPLPPPGEKGGKPPLPLGMSPCHPNPCQNGGTCHEFDSGHNYACICAVGFDGTHCQEDICAGCHVFAICPHGRCKCKHGYIGDGYDCYKDNCENCHPQANCVYGECACKEGYRGNGAHCSSTNATTSVM